MNERIPLYQSIYTDLKNKILNKELTKNTKLESVRNYSNRLGISTTTIEKAYNQLLIEGYVKSVPRSGFFVIDVHNQESVSSNQNIEPIKYQFHSNNKLTEDLFDIKSYKSTINKVINYDSEKLYSECDPRGELELREEIRKYVLNERDVKCDVNQIIIGPGIQSLLHILLSITDYKSVTYLNPEFKKAMNIFIDYNFTLKPRDTIYEITRLKSDFIYISPSNIYPTGEVLKVKDRNDIIKWAKENDTYIIEDDYNFFIRYNSYTIPSMHSYDSNRVVYMGSFSKTIIPSIRMSFMILPPKLYEIYKDLYQNYSQGVGKLEQLSLALFMKEGLFKRHTKKLYNLYKQKNDTFLEELNKYQDVFQVYGTDSNLHVIIDFIHYPNLVTFISNCEESHYKYELIQGTNRVIFPYSGFEVNEISDVVSKLLGKIKR